MGEENFFEEKNLIQKQRSYRTAFRNCGGLFNYLCYNI